MTRFEDGPAKGQVLMLKRAPYFLRVTEADGKWDALDQLDDEPSLSERLFAYELMGKPGVVFMRPGGTYPAALYRFVERQPTDLQMRDGRAWALWVEGTAAARGLK